LIEYFFSETGSAAARFSDSGAALACAYFQLADLALMKYEMMVEYHDVELGGKDR
jgi:hypothetical protein